MTKYQQIEGLQVSTALRDFIEREVLPGLNIARDNFWRGFAQMITEYAPKNSHLLEVRQRLQCQIDDWHQTYGAASTDMPAYITHLRQIGYIEPEVEDFTINPTNCDPEITDICGPQLVVPMDNARYVLNAANARWGSLYDALYGSDVIADEGRLAQTSKLNPARVEEVFTRTADFLDENFPLETGSHRQAVRYRVEAKHLIISLNNGQETHLRDDQAFIGWQEEKNKLTLLLKHHQLHVEWVIDRHNSIGQLHQAGLADIYLESAITAIADCEDSVAAIDVEDKIKVYRHWLLLMKGELTASFDKNGKVINRSLNKDRSYNAVTGGKLTLPGRALLLVRNVGLLMTSEAVLDEHNQPIPEGLLDAIITVLCACHDLNRRQNSRTGSIYIVKPKLHGSFEVAFVCAVFATIEQFLSLPKNTIKIGLMDEERRTSANLKNCIHAARERIFFINTGFLDRTGDEIHTSMQAGVVLPKNVIKSASWLQAYEDRNVILGLQCGFSGRAQIGKGMWAMPDNMAAMVFEKITQPRAGANCAWVPSPTAATLHALHYHQVDVFAARRAREKEQSPTLETLFSMPVLDPNPPPFNNQELEQEIENNAQGILGYVVRWVDQGIGCSKVPDIHNVSLMEDRATCRISAQIIANWLKWGVITHATVKEIFKRMAALVDQQNAFDPAYIPMSPDFEHNLAFQAALALAFQGTSQPCGYTEPILHHFRRFAKSVGRA